MVKCLSDFNVVISDSLELTHSGSNVYFSHRLVQAISKLHSIVYILKSLNLIGDCDYSIMLLKDLVGRLATELATGHYVDGLAAELGSHMKKLWDVNVSEWLLRDFLHSALELKEATRTAESEVSEVLENFLSIFEVDVSASPLLSKLLKSGINRELALQIIATGLIVSVGGVGCHEHSFTEV